MQNSFDICFKDVIEIHENLSLDAQCHPPAFNQSYTADGSDFEFCLEHGHGIHQTIEMVAEYYRFVADQGHSQTKLNHTRCLSLLGRWRP